MCGAVSTYTRPESSKYNSEHEDAWGLAVLIWWIDSRKRPLNNDTANKCPVLSVMTAVVLAITTSKLYFDILPVEVKVLLTYSGMLGCSLH
jgi:hypothetical protein